MTAERRLSFYAYAVGELDAPAPPRTQHKLLEYLHAPYQLEMVNFLKNDGSYAWNKVSMNVL